MTFNKFTDKWELSEPIAYIKDGLTKEYISNLNWSQFWSALNITKNGILLLFCSAVLVGLGTHILKNLKIRIQNKFFR